MTKPIEFPMNYQRYIELGKEALTLGDYQIARENFESAYNLEQKIEANQLLVTTLLKLDCYGEALIYVHELHRDYLIDEDSFAIYIAVLIGNDCFVKAAQHIFDKKNENWNVADCEQKLQLASDHFMVFQKTAQESWQMKIASLASEPLIKQLAILKEVERVPAVFYLELVLPLLSSQELTLIVRQGLLFEVLKLRSNQPVSVIDLMGNSRVILPEDIAHLNAVEAEVKEKIIQHIQRVLEFEAGELKEQLLKECDMHFKVMYPFAHEWIRDSALWTEQFLARYLGENPHVDYDENVYHGQEKTMNLIQEELLQLMLR